MWSGIEDVYCTQTGFEVPEGFFFMMASFAETVYLRSPSKKIARMFSVGDGRPEHTYGNMKEILGLDYRICAGSDASYALKMVMSEIDKNRPVVLGPLDMFHLPYLKMYHRVHIPIHYILMVGYDTQKDCVLIFDCDREELLELSIEELMRAWNVEKNAVGGRNGYVKFTLAQEQKTPFEIMEYSMKRKAMTQLAEKPYLVGITAFDKLAKEFRKWKDEMDIEVYKRTLSHLPEYWGRVPKLPNRLMGMQGNQPDIPYKANMDRFSNCLKAFSKMEGGDRAAKASELFEQSGSLYQDITEHIISYLCDGEDSLQDIPELLLDIGRLYQRGYEYFIE